MDVLRSVLPKNTGYSLVEGGGQSPSNSTDSTLRQWLAARGKAVVLFVISLTLLTFYIILPRPASHDESLSDATFKKSANFHMVMPTVKANENVCRFIVSGGILGYPAPIFTNWDEEFDDADAAHAAKVKGILDWTNRLDASHDDDLVLLSDSHDVWMQLRPQNLIDRYFEINRRADRRLKSEFGDITVNHDLRQDIVFAGQQDCAPWSKDDPACFAVPTSSLKSDMSNQPKKSRWRRKSDERVQYKQPHLNAAIAVGPVKAMRRLFEQAMKEIDTGTHLGSNQNLLSHIYGEQELWREVLRRDTLKSKGVKGDADRKARTKFTSKWSQQRLDEIRAKAAEREDGSLEFGIGIDYSSEISLSTAYAKNDGEWIKFSNSAHSQSTQLPSDIADALPPFWTFSVEDLPRWTSWKDTPLYTHIPSGITPTMLKLPELSHPPITSAEAQKEAEEQTKMWTSMFYHKHSRVLFDAFVYAPVLPLAISGYDDAHRREWWTMEWAKAGMHDGVGGWKPYGEFCQEYVPDIFRDGKGDWSVPDWN